VFNFSVILEGIFKVHLGTSILLLQILNVTQGALATGSTKSATFKGKHFQSRLKIMSGFGVFVPGKLDASLESDQVGYNHVLILIFSEVNTVFNVLLAETCFFYNKHIGDVINKKKHDIFLFVDLLHFLIKLRSFVRLIEIGLKVRQVNQRFLTMKFLFLFLFIR
jgi:hypothetical protein